MLGHGFWVQLHCPCKANFVLVVFVGSEFFFLVSGAEAQVCLHISSTAFKVASLK